jgi:hypothetical protein
MTAPATPVRSNSSRLAMIVILIVLGVIFAVIGVIYETQTAGHLPSFLPGHQVGAAGHHIKHGIAAFALAVIAWLGAWFVTGRRSPATSGSDEE